MPGKAEESQETLPRWPVSGLAPGTSLTPSRNATSAPFLSSQAFNL